MTATYWEMGRRIVEFEQRGKERAGYGEEIITSLAAGLTERFGRGFGVSQLKMMRQFHLLYRGHSAKNDSAISACQLRYR